MKLTLNIDLTNYKIRAMRPVVLGQLFRGLQKNLEKMEEEFGVVAFVMFEGDNGLEVVVEGTQEQLKDVKKEMGDWIPATNENVSIKKVTIKDKLNAMRGKASSKIKKASVKGVEKIGIKISYKIS